jgi:UvrD/REP helicase N-terminal domain
VLAAAVHALPSPPAGLIAARLEGAEIRLRPEEVAELIAAARAQSSSYAAGRERLRMRLVRAFYDRYATRLGAAACRSFDDVEAALRTGGFLNRTLEAIWPRTTAAKVVRRLLTSWEALAEAASGILDGDEQRLLQSGRGRGWSDADLPLLDEAHALLEGAGRPHGHVIVDEAQDLTPMQLRMLARRSAGPMTIIGDIAQAAGSVSYRRWDELLPFLAPEATAEVEELRLAYRVPREVMELALPLLPLIAPDVAAPIAHRDGASGRASSRRRRSTWSPRPSTRRGAKRCARDEPP